jgi:eukaryotic-like serine/threonine-protein kinase
MDLWTEYEGRTIDGAFPLTKLIRPEGRSAFFSTPNGTGQPTVIRLIESHFDGDEILARWRGVSALKHPNLVNLKKFGHVVVDETPLVYAVMETVDGNLGEILKERRLTEEETREVATSMLAAIEALHANGFVHEHIEPGNVMAVGDAIKLRSDCIREAPEGDEGYALKQRDVHDYAVVLVEALTQKKMLEGPLPAPFYEIVRKGMNGDWGLTQIGAALKSTAAPISAPIAAPPVSAAPISAAPVVAQPVVRPVTADAPVEKRVATPPLVTPPSVSRRIHVPVDEERSGLGPRGIAYGVGILLLVLLGWYFVHSRTGSSKSVAQEAAVLAPVSPPPVAPTTAPVVSKSSAAKAIGANTAPRHAAVVAANTPVSADGSEAAGSGRWRVVAFTYNREDQAQQKVASIAQSNPDLSPSVFTPNGHAPFLVTLGGQMSKQEAFAFSGKAKREGMPADTYAQNYRGTGN